MEKNIEMLIGRRLERWSMRWNRPGAHTPLQFRLSIHCYRAEWFEALNSSHPQLTNA